ncbi:BGTF surface domain-containing protein [Halobacterium wangiae]|uniref:DUF7827 domain-containing protein n=1 Tax=Halobacterium wangiae TaxID=2902623 RepID=UPI001E3EAE38|nr:BGTF surface domain-containing protein [Halobacterium wangiae]
MTSNSDKLRAVFLTALMIGSVFAAGIAFTGGAAAITSTSADNVNVADGTQDQTVSFTAEAGTDFDGTATGTASITFDEVQNLAFQGVTLTSADQGGSDVSSAVTVSQSGGTVTVDISEADVSSGTNIAIVLTVSVDASSSSATTGAAYSIASDGGSLGSGSTATDATFDITNNPGDGTDDTTFNDGGIVFQGQTAAFDAADGDTNGDSYSAGGYTLYEQTSSDTGSPVRELDTNNGWVNASTSGLDTGTTYFISNDGSNPSSDADVTFTIREQNFDASFDGDSVTNEGDIDLTFESTNRQNEEYTVVVMSEGLDDEDLVDIFDDNYNGVSNIDVNDDDDIDGDGIVITVPAGGDETAAADFTEIDTGSYDFDFVVADTTASDSASVNVTDAADSNTEFVEVSTTARGDIATFNISLTNAEQATVQIGSDGVGYLANVTVTDDDGDGYAAFNVNTYTMGNNTAANASDPGVAFYGVADSETIVNSVDFGTPDLDEPIADGTYRTSVRYGDDVTDTANDVSRLAINPADGVTGQNIWTAPGGSVTSLADVLADAPLSQDDSIAEGDYLIHEVEASGVFGILQNASADDPRQALLNATESGELALTVEQTDASTRQNRDSKTLNYTEALNDSEAIVSTDAANSTFYIVTDLTEINTTEDDRSIRWDNDVYNASVSLQESSLLVSENASASAEFSADTWEASLSMDEYEVESASNQTIEGTSTAADGTSLNVLVESTETPGEGFIFPENEAVVQDGEFNASVNFSGVEVDSEFAISLEDSDGEVDDATGTVVESVDDGTTTTTDDGTTTTTADDTTTTADDTTTTTADDTTTTEGPGGDTGGDDGGDDGSDGGIPGFGMGIALVAILGAALLALRE